MDPGVPVPPGRLYATAEAHFGDAPEVLAVDALGGQQQLGRQADRCRLELEPDDPPVEEAEVERHRSREVAVAFEQERRPEDVGGAGGPEREVRDIGGRVVREAHGILRNRPRHGGSIGEGAQGTGSRSVVIRRECDPPVPARVARVADELERRRTRGS
jgi:hypothetical protein